MKVFITGVTGYIGSAVAKALLAKGHEVTALVRSTSMSDVPKAIRVVEGGLDTILDLLDEVEKHDAFVHTAQSPTPDMVQLDENAVEAFTRFREGGRTFVYTSGVWVLGSSGSRVDDEATPPDPIDMVKWRAGHEERVRDAARSDFSTAVIRPGCVYGHHQSLLGDVFVAADKSAPVQIVGDGNNKWALCHVDDVATQYVAVVEQKASGIFHAVDDSTCTLNEMAAAIIKSRGSDSEIEHVPPDVARKAMGSFTDALLIDQQVRSLDSRARLGWQPTRDFLGSVYEQWKEWEAARNA
jgi:nucleoside-diphosphate-sugar epimerase